MMNVEISHNCSDFDSYRAARVKSMFNAENGCNWQKSINIDLPGDWQLGLIVGKSGSGKTSLGKQFFEGNKIYDLYDNWDNTKPIIDCILPNGSFDAVTSSLSGVGLGDVPSWLRPFKALSNGQQFRAGLARVLSEAPDEVIIDEFTSVVDRQIAKVGALAFGKAWKRNKDKRAVLLSCHYDIIEWLQPDWVYDIDTDTLKKKAKLGNDQASKLIFGRSTSVTGEILKSIII
jgi:ABC-type dipeptide/oligopeptide/nickel transport system ATPase subunit